MNTKDFLSIRDFPPSEIQYLLILGRQVKADPTGFSTALRRQTLAMIFEKPSLRTRVTFDVGIQQLGGYSLYLSPAEINLGKRESVYDVAKNLERMVQGIMMRTFDHEVVVQMAQYASIPVINGLTDYSHPCQAMADYLTIWIPAGGGGNLPRKSSIADGRRNSIRSGTNRQALCLHARSCHARCVDHWQGARWRVLSGLGRPGVARDSQCI